MAFYDLRRALLIRWWWHFSFVIFEPHERRVQIFDVPKRGLAVGRLGRMVLANVRGIWTLDVKKRSRRLGVAKGDLSKRAFDDERLVLRTRLRSLDSASDLLFHPLHMIITAARVMPTTTITIATACLEEVCLSELVQRLAGAASWGTTYLSIDLVVEILGQLLLAARLIVDATRGSQQLLKLDPGNEVLVLGRHETIVLAQEEDLVISLGTFGFFSHVCLSVFWSHVHHLLGLCYWRAIV